MKRPQNVSFLERGIRSLVDSNDKWINGFIGKIDAAQN